MDGAAGRDRGAGGLDDVTAWAIGGQQHGMVALDADGRVIRPALLWNDTRSAGAAADLIAEFGAEALAQRTGLVPVASFTITKLRWLRDHEPENAARVAAVALPHDWLTWRLRGFGPAGESSRGPVLEELVTDRSDASGTGYWNPATDGYDVDLLMAALGHEAVLPRVLAPDEWVEDDAGRRVGPGAGDNAGAALGLQAQPGDVVISIGTSGTVFAVSEQRTIDPTGTVAGFADADGRFLPLVATLNAARVLDAIARVLDVDHAELSRLALAAEPGAQGLTLVPYFEGERTPNLPDATASLSGMTLASTSRENLARAAVEGMLPAWAPGSKRSAHSAFRCSARFSSAAAPSPRRCAPSRRRCWACRWRCPNRGSTSPSALRARPHGSRRLTARSVVVACRPPPRRSDDGRNASRSGRPRSLTRRPVERRGDLRKNGRMPPADDDAALDEIAVELYARSPEEFTAARNARAAASDRRTCRPREAASQAHRRRLGGRPPRAGGPARRRARAGGGAPRSPGGPRRRRALPARPAAPGARRRTGQAGGRPGEGRRRDSERGRAGGCREDDQCRGDGCRGSRRGDDGAARQTPRSRRVRRGRPCGCAGRLPPGGTESAPRDDLAERRARKAAEKAAREAERAANEAERELATIEAKRDKARERADHVGERIEDLRRDLERLESESQTLAGELERLDREHADAASRARTASKDADRARRALEG